MLNAPDYNCPLCPRLLAFRESNRLSYPAFYNGPVPSFGALDAELLVVGLAPGLKGANQTGRPFTGDYAGLVLYSALKKFGFAVGEYDPKKVSGFRIQDSSVKDKVSGVRMQDAGKRNTFLNPESRILTPTPTPSTDGFHLTNCRITNAARCVPPENKPEPSEIKTCNNFLKSEIAAMPNLKVILSLGLISHKSVLMALGLKQSAYTFEHGAAHFVYRGNASPDFAPRNLPREVVVKNSSAVSMPLMLLNSYHCSRYNINTGRLTQAMFDEVVAQALTY